MVMNDSAYGAEVLFFMEKNKPPTLAQVDDVDFAAIARAFGARGLTVRTLADMDVVAAEVLKKGGPLVVDVKTRTVEGFETSS